MLAVLLMALCAAYTGPASFWPKVTGTVLIILTLRGLALAALGPVRRLRSERGVARFVGRRHPPLASDLLSAVELAVPRPARSRALHRASCAPSSASWPAAVSPLDVRRLVPLRPAARPRASPSGAALLVLAVRALAAAGHGGQGPGPADPGAHPLRGRGGVRRAADRRRAHHLHYPAYTGLPPRVVEGSTGDIVAVKGTEVVLETKLLRSAREALLLLGDQGEGGEQPVQADRRPAEGVAHR